MKTKNLTNDRAIIGLAHGCIAIGAIFWGMGGDCDAAIIYPKAPAGGRQIVIENVGHLLREQPGTLGGLHIEDLTIGDPHRCYIVEVNDLAAGHLLSTAKFYNDWRYLLIHGGKAVGEVELIASGKDGKTLKFNSLGEPFFPNATLEALQMAEQLPQIKKQDYEVRYLDIIHHYMAIWLHGKTDDIIIPLLPTFAPLTAYHPYSEGEIIKLLRKEAQRDQKMAAEGAKYD